MRMGGTGPLVVSLRLAWQTLGETIHGWVAAMRSSRRILCSDAVEHTLPLEIAQP